MSRHSVIDRDDTIPAWAINQLLHAEAVECTFSMPGYGRCGAQPGQRCRTSDGTYLAPNGKTLRGMPAHFTRYSAADAQLGRGQASTQK